MASMIINLGELLKLRNEIQQLAQNLSASLKSTDQLIDEVAKTWKDDNFIKFKAKFEDDKNQLLPLSKSLVDYDETYLARIEMAVRKYTGHN